MKTKVAVLLAIIMMLGSGMVLLRAETNKSAAELFTRDQYIKMLGAKIDLDRVEHKTYPHMPRAMSTIIPSQFDWRDFGILTGVRDQSFCGSCWAFAGVAQLESAIYRYEGNAADLSEQQVLDCSYDSGCDGGYTYYALEYIYNNGIILESSRPYKAVEGACDIQEQPVYFIKDFGDVWVGDNALAARVKAFKDAIINDGPIATYMIVYQDFNGYSGGVYMQNSDVVDGGHMVLVVGWKDDPSISTGGYWIIKNSWGPSWGESGYFRIGYGQAEIDTYFTTLVYATKTSNNPPAFTSNIGNKSGVEMESISFSALANDPDGDDIIYYIDKMPEGADMDARSGQFTWTPTAEQAGTYTFRVVAFDGTAYDTQSVTLTIKNKKYVTK